ncbi:MAG TPA: hypothetical protein VFI41_04885 [Gemmatimonadales bacterium]|nr:hypothetical protein [Gemmatimonadales bacterium]
MPLADHCAKALPRVTPDVDQLQVQCPVCLSLWIYENKRWSQFSLEEQKRHGLVPT